MDFVLHRLEIDERLGIALLDGERLTSLPPGSKAWVLLVALARAGPTGLQFSALYPICSGETVQRKEDVYNVVRRLRDSLRLLAVNAEHVVQHFGSGCWRLVADVKIVEPGSLARLPFAATPRQLESPRFSGRLRAFGSQGHSLVVDRG
jgi:hypothetical protein